MPISFSSIAVMVGLGASVAQAAPNPEAGHQIYARACAPCHGARGKGDGPAARYLDPKPRNFVAGLYKLRSTDAVSPPTDADLERSVGYGLPGTSMPAWRDALRDDQITDVVAYIKTFSASFDGAPAEPLEVSPRPESTKATIEAGRAVYAASGCATCHGTSGNGDGVLAAHLKDHRGNALQAKDFRSGVYKSGTTDVDLFRTISTGFAGTPMPGFATALSASDRWMLVHYLRSLEVSPGISAWLFDDEPNRL